MKIFLIQDISRQFDTMYKYLSDGNKNKYEYYKHKTILSECVDNLMHGNISLTDLMDYIHESFKTISGYGTNIQDTRTILLASVYIQNYILDWVRKNMDKVKV